MIFNHIRKLSFIAIWLIFLYSQGYAQQSEPRANGKISGKIVDSLTMRAIEYATISLVRQQDNKIINGTTTDDQGVFKLTGVPEGTYKLMVYFIGYKPAEKKEIIISKSNSTTVLNNIALVNLQTTLKEVTIETEKSLIENKIDKMVYNAEKDLTSQGGVATDILKKVPQVSVDVDGNVELQGNSNIRFLINGKPSSIFGNNIADVLQSLPASQIQSIEVITSPGAKYDAEGTGGIINIILKKSDAQGINGNLSLTGGTRLENGSFNLNGRKGKFIINAFASGNAQLLSTTINTMNRQSTDAVSHQTAGLLQSGRSDFNRNGYQSGLSFDWALSSRDNLTGSFNFNHNDNNNIGLTNRQSILQDASGNTLSNISNLINATNSFSLQSFDWSLNYKRKFKKEEQELDILYTASDASNYSYFQQTQKFVTPDSIFNSSYGKNPGTDNQTNISLNYTHPISKQVLLETGAKTVLSQFNSKSDVYLLDINTFNYDYNTNQSSSIDYKRSIYAGYVSGTIKLKVLDIKAGCRYEYTDTKASFSNVGNVNIKPYNTIIPSGIVSHTFKNNNSIKLSYSHRLQRPDYRDLNPFVNSTDPKNITTGNPNLIPEYSDNTELSFNSFSKKGMNINASVFYRRNGADIQPYTRYYSNYKIGDSTYSNVAVTTRENIGIEHNIGINFFISVPLTKQINIRSNLSGFQRYIINSIDPGLNVSGFNYRINLNATYKVNSLLNIEVFGNFNSPRVGAQGIQPSFTTYNFAFRLLLFKKKGSIALTATNPFDKYVNQKTQTTGSNFTLNSLRELPYRSFGINFTYKFGKLEFKKQKEPEDSNLTNPNPGN